MEPWSPLRRVAAFTLCLLVSNGAAADPVSFRKDVRPILVARCFKCHSSAEQKSGLRLDSVEAIIKGGELGPAMIPGKSGDSSIYLAMARIGDLKMPPEGPGLSEAEISIVKKWIDEGAQHSADDDDPRKGHWSFRPPLRGSIPTTTIPFTNPVDRFLQAERETKDITCLPKADKRTLLRRVYLDLVGVPPTPEQIVAFEKDETDTAFDTVVDQLLASPMYGQRWGRHWMDVWRYSDWDGFGQEIRESKPHIWRWRDWIVDSLNDNKPYNQMIMEMIAGDEISPGDENVERATGFLVRNWFKFNRNTWLDNTVEHTSKAFLGLTIQCARCHDHMYDPIAQKEYYQFRAFFEPYDVRTDALASEPDTDKDGVVRAYDANPATPTYVFRRGNDKDPIDSEPLSPLAPKILETLLPDIKTAPLPPTVFYPGLRAHVREKLLGAIRLQIEKTTRDAAEAESALRAAQSRLKLVHVTQPPTLVFSDDFEKPSGSPEIQRDWEFAAGNWTAAAGALIQSELLSGKAEATLSKETPRNFAFETNLTVEGGAMYRSMGVSFDKEASGDEVGVYVTAIESGPKVQLWLRRQGKDVYPPEASRPIESPLGKTTNLRVEVLGGVVNAYVNGKFQFAYTYSRSNDVKGRLSVWTFDATGKFHDAKVEQLPDDHWIWNPGEEEEAAKGDRENAVVRSLSSAREKSEIASRRRVLADLALEAFHAKVKADEAAYYGSDPEETLRLAIDASSTERKIALLEAEVNRLAAASALRIAKSKLVEGDAAKQKAVTDAEAALASAEKSYSEAALAFGEPKREYLRLTPVYPANSTGRRTALARMIASDENPLTPRVAINHMWLRHFGAPLVSSVFDFGQNGKSPTHPELLDYLARELVDSGWDMKRLHRLMVTSEAYQLSSHVRVNGAEIVRADPENRFYGRANVRRMEAETIRDSVLATSGGLETTLGGPDLEPNMAMSSGRRSLYFRASKEKKSPFLALFDSANVVECYRRSESVAPQQALAMANSPLTIDRSRTLAKALGPVASGSDARFIALAFERILGRAPSNAETTTCLAFLEKQAGTLSKADALTSFTSGESSTVAPASDPAERARENLVHALFNHNDFVTIR